MSEIPREKEPQSEPEQQPTPEQPEPVNKPESEEEKRAKFEEAKLERIKRLCEEHSEGMKKIFAEAEIRANQAIQKIKEKKENKQKLLEKLTLIEKGFDPNDEACVEGLGELVVSQLNKLFGIKYGLSVSEESLPWVMIEKEKDNPPSYKQYRKEDGSIIDVIKMRNIDDALNGNTFGEEMAHFYRQRFKPNETNEEITNEFFGFLGKRLWQKASPELTGDLSVLVDYEEQEVRSKRETLDISKYIRGKIKSAKEGKPEAGDPSIEEMLAERRNLLIHERGYEFADKLDLDKIHDWKKLFSLPNKEVRKRFFTDKPDYSGL